MSLKPKNLDENGVSTIFFEGGLQNDSCFFDFGIKNFLHLLCIYYHE